MLRYALNNFLNVGNDGDEVPSKCVSSACSPLRTGERTVTEGDATGADIVKLRLITYCKQVSSTDSDGCERTRMEQRDGRE